MHAEGLYEKLAGAFADGTPLRQVPSESRRQRSVVDHLQRLLETRKGMLVHMPAFGMPDVADLYRRLPASAGEFQAEVEAMIRSFEPRLEDVRVQLAEFDAMRARLSFRISGTLIGGETIEFETAFFPTGRAVVRSAD